MFKRILFYFIIISNVSYSQLSNKHWLPPLHCRDGSAVADHYVYLSTAETTPFEVVVTDGSGTPIPGSPFTLSSLTPVTISVGSGQNTKMFLDINEVNTVLSDKGLILQGAKDFYASFRVRSQNHSETLISKGRPGIGTSFRLGCMINESQDNRKSFVASIMATENNTNVALTDYDPGIVFATASGDLTIPSQTFTLDAGESVIFTGYSSYAANLDGIIGALVTSNKPVAVNTGNALGGIENNRADFTLDQIVSASQIGTEYIFIQGNGLPTMELPLIVANENNTEIYINNILTPVATINAGDYYLVDNSYYQGTINKNVFVKTTKPVFAYQLLGGESYTATAGLNFIPPLSCFFQNAVNIPAVNRIGNTIYTADLMVLTYSSSVLTVNGSVVPTTQAQNVLGNSDWVTYRVSNVSGNTNVSSTGPLAVGVFGFLGTSSGFAGYYSGFGSNPEDTDVAVCSNETINLFDAITGNPGPNGTWTVPDGGAILINNTFDPLVHLPGEYTYNFTKDCNATVVTIPVKVNVTVQQAPFAGTSNSISTCINATTFDLFSLLGTNVTTGGNWEPALNSGTSIFDPAVDVSGVYTYRILGVGVCEDVIASITVTNNPVPTPPFISNFALCDTSDDDDDTNGFVTFDLTQKNDEIASLIPGYSISYHTSEAEANSASSSITSIYSTNRIIYVRLTNSTNGCYFIATFNLVVHPKPIVNALVTLKQCDIDTDAITVFNLTQANERISSVIGLTFTYHNSLAGAENNTDFVVDEINFQAANGNTVWARITNSNGCFRTAQVNLIVSATTIPQTYLFTIDDVCDDYIDSNDPDGDGIGYFDLTEIEPALIAQFPTGQSYIFSYYFNQIDAETEQNGITNSTNFRNTIPTDQTIWVRIESNLYDCAGLGPFLKLKVNPLPDVDLGPDFVLCIDPVTGLGSQTVDATPSTPGNYSYQWTPANPNGNSHLYTISTSGTFSVIVTNNDTNCVNSDTLTTTFSSEPEIFEANLITPAFSSGLASIEAVATGGFGTYEYSINAIDWQSSPIFSGLENGSYIIYVRDIQGCGILFSDELQTITYPNFFTPNGDGYNDYWSIRLPNEYEGIISIYDRYGNLLKQLSASGQGWDGTFNGNQLPSTDYWFKVEYIENNKKKEFKSHFSLKR